MTTVEDVDRTENTANADRGSAGPPPCGSEAYESELFSQDTSENRNEEGLSGYSDGRFRLSYEEDGVYLEISPPAEYGTAAEGDKIMAYIKRKNLQQLMGDPALEAIRQSSARTLIAPPQTEYLYGEEAEITISQDEMEATLKILPPEEGGGVLTLELLCKAIEARGVVYGIDENLVRMQLDSKVYGEELCIAKGTLPEDGTDGKLVFHFNMECLSAPEINEKDGKVDYRTLKLFEQVTAGQVLVTREPATQGTPGSTVTGRVLKPKSGKEARMPAGKNVEYDEGRLTMKASITGRVDYNRSTVTVSSCYNIRGDADLSVGNVAFEGDVVITGNVISELTIRASGNIEVYGVVEGARLTAGGNIVLRSGIQGNDKGVLEAGRDVLAKYIERTKIKAGGNITSDSIIHCFAESGGIVTAKGKHGSIIGGSIKAQNSIAAQNIGSVVYNKTTIEVGIAPEKRARLKFLIEETERLRQEIEKFDKISKYLIQIESLPPEKEQLKKTVVLGKIKNNKLIGEYSVEIQRIEEDIKKAETGTVHVKDTIYPGVKLTISLGEYVVTTPIKYATFKCRNREISFSSCEI